MADAYPRMVCDLGFVRLDLVEKDGALVAASFTDGPATEAPTPLLARAASQLAKYVAGARRDFDLSLAPTGTDFQRLVWAELARIPYGQTRTYGEVAAAIGHPRAARAVGAACNRNPIAVIVPCHRVVGAGGSLVGYAGGLDVKQALLALEHDGA